MNPHLYLASAPPVLAVVLFSGTSRPEYSEGPHADIPKPAIIAHHAEGMIRRIGCSRCRDHLHPDRRHRPLRLAATSRYSDGMDLLVDRTLLGRRGAFGMQVAHYRGRCRLLVGAVAIPWIGRRTVRFPEVGDLGRGGAPGSGDRRCSHVMKPVLPACGICSRYSSKVEARSRQVVPIDRPAYVLYIMVTCSMQRSPGFQMPPAERSRDRIVGLPANFSPSRSPSPHVLF